MSLIQWVVLGSLLAGLLGVGTAWLLEPRNYNFLWTWSWILLLVGIVGSAIVFF